MAGPRPPPPVTPPRTYMGTVEAAPDFVTAEGAGAGCDTHRCDTERQVQHATPTW